MSITSDVPVASSEQDARAVEAVEQHHAELAGQLVGHTEALLSAARQPDRTGFAEARRAALAFCTEELLPHARAEEETLYPAAARAEQARLLIRGMLAEHERIGRLVDELTTAAEPVRAAAAGYALNTLFATHLAKENELLLPIVAADPAASLADLVGRMHELIGPVEPAAEVPGACGCSESDQGIPELDVRTVPHAIRHATVFGAFDAVPPGGSLVLIAPHDPLPLLRQLRQRAGVVDVRYLERGPEAWRLLLTRS